MRLEAEKIVRAQGSGRRKIRVVINPAVLAETWSQEEKPPIPVLRGYLYGSTPQAIVGKAVQACPGGAVAGAFAANLHASILTRPPYPIRFWIPETFSNDRLPEFGIKETDEGANIELMRCKGDPWRVNIDTKDIPKVSGWRAWIEIASATGRTKELATALFNQLKGDSSWT